MMKNYELKTTLVFMYQLQCLYFYSVNKEKCLKWRNITRDANSCIYMDHFDNFSKQMSCDRATIPTYGAGIKVLC